ncbi:glutaminyl-peptide cyclotransferase [uncultured Brevundimonas sp.]|uniref:glutaminyl-peptide cyclotransferase n=1 Tax=uncultured Brevundimonas sp. TaxID=213418 RepID=UPI00263635D3|nr:glutaminyl-peptide cyclotransferase [uncultured Brevundimonas sp.]
MHKGLAAFVVAVWAGLFSPALAVSGQEAAKAMPPVYDYEVVATYPHDRAAFTQGLVIRDGVLLESTGRGLSTVRRVRLEDGVVLDRKILPSQHFGEGLTELNGRIYSITWQTQTGFIWNKDDLSPIGQFTYEGEGWGLTTDGQRLILSDGTPKLRFFDPETLTETGSVDVTLAGRPLNQLNELEWIDGEVWANVWQSDFIVRINPADGVVSGIIDLRGLLPAGSIRNPLDDVLNGIAWDEASRRLFVTGKNWPALYEITVQRRD